MSGGLGGRSSQWVAGLALLAMMAVYALCAGTLALRRHWNLETQALDMGYADQVTWNMSQGRFFRFTVFRGQIGEDASGPLPIGAGGDRDSLLSYHTELLFIPLAVLYLVWPGPETLIVLLTVALALGAVPVYLLAQQQLRHRGAALIFSTVYLLTPSVQAANLADFHVVSMAPLPLLTALYCMTVRRYRAMVAASAVAALMKEEVGLLVAMLGFWLWLCAGERRLGLGVAGAALLWVTLCVTVIIPRHNGGTPSLFAARYGDALRHAFGWPGAVLDGHPVWPVPSYSVEYLREMLSGTGVLALLAPARLLLAAPVLAINALSSSPWQHGGGAHYSAEAVPGILFATIGGARAAAVLARGWKRIRIGALPIAALAVLAPALWQVHEEGILPPARRFHWTEPSGRLAALQPLLARIPPEAPVSAQSNTFPHLSRRERIYVFPAVEDARFVLLDVAGTSDPLLPDELFNRVRALLSHPGFQLLDGSDGFLLFERREPSVGPPAASGVPVAPQVLPDRFLRFGRPPPSQRLVPAAARFGEGLEVVGYDLAPLLEVSFGVRRVLPVIVARAQGEVGDADSLSVFRVGRDGLAHRQEGGNATQLWYPTTRWRSGELYALRYPPITYLPGQRLGIGAQAGAGPSAFRLRVTGEALPTTDGGQVAILGAFP